MGEKKKAKAQRTKGKHTWGTVGRSLHPILQTYDKTRSVPASSNPDIELVCTMADVFLKVILVLGTAGHNLLLHGSNCTPHNYLTKPNLNVYQLNFRLDFTMFVATSTCLHKRESVMEGKSESKRRWSQLLGISVSYFCKFYKNIRLCKHITTKLKLH